MRNTKQPIVTSTSIYTEASKRIQELQTALKVTEKSLLNVPEGKLHLLNKKGIAQYYIRKDPKDKTGEYLSKSNRKLIREHLQKSYDLKVKKLVEDELKNLLKCVRKNENLPYELEQLYMSYPKESRNMIVPVAKPYEEIESEWLAKPYDKMPIDEGAPYYETNRGERVRSKSELNIANMLDKYHIAYKYEYPVMLNNGFVVRPDFTLLDQRTLEEIYCEHRGMMDNPEYAQRAVIKFKNYMQSGIVLGKNLIITEETSLSPLGTDEICIILRNLL
jgi:hypothetical protein